MIRLQNATHFTILRAASSRFKTKLVNRPYPWEDLSSFHDPICKSQRNCWNDSKYNFL